jgi:hypothetical protein
MAVQFPKKASNHGTPLPAVAGETRRDVGHAAMMLPHERAAVSAFVLQLCS